MRLMPHHFCPRLRVIGSLYGITLPHAACSYECSRLVVETPPLNRTTVENTAANRLELYDDPTTRDLMPRPTVGSMDRLYEFPADAASDLTALAVLGSGSFLSGHNSGVIHQWKMSGQQPFLSFQLVNSFREHNSPVRKLIRLDAHGRFASLDTSRVLLLWSTAQPYRAAQRVILTGGRADIDDIAVLHEVEAAAVIGMRSQAWACFDIFDTSGRRRQLLHTDMGGLHRPHGVSVERAAYGYLAVHGHCEYKLSVWRVTEDECADIRN